MIFGVDFSEKGHFLIKLPLFLAQILKIPFLHYFSPYDRVKSLSGKYVIKKGENIMYTGYSEEFLEKMINFIASIKFIIFSKNSSLYPVYNILYPF